MKKNEKETPYNKEFERLKELLEQSEIEACQACGGSLRIERVNLEEYEGGKLFVMDSIPAYVCNECGETWVPDTIMSEFEKMIETVKDSRLKKISAKKKKGAT